MGVGIYEARRNSVAPGKHFLVSRCTPKIANGDDPVARNSDIGIEARRAGPVENGGIADGFAFFSFCFFTDSFKYIY